MLSSVYDGRLLLSKGAPQQEDDALVVGGDPPDHGVGYFLPTLQRTSCRLLYMTIDYSHFFLKSGWWADIGFS